MKKALWVVLLGVWFGCVGTVNAEDMRIGYVDLHKVMTESKAGKQAKSEIEKVFNQRKESLQADEKKLKEMQQAYEKGKLLLSDAQKQEKKREFDKALNEYRQSKAEAQREIQQREQQYAQSVLPKIRAIINDVAKEQKLTLVFEKKGMPVLYAADGPDLTDIVIKRFDAKGGS